MRCHRAFAGRNGGTSDRAPPPFQRRPDGDGRSFCWHCSSKQGSAGEAPPHFTGGWPPTNGTRGCSARYARTNCGHRETSGRQPHLRRGALALSRPALELTLRAHPGTTDSSPKRIAKVRSRSLSRRTLFASFCFIILRRHHNQKNRRCLQQQLFNLAVTLPAVWLGFGVGTLTGGASC